MKHWYAAYAPYGTEFTFETSGYVFYRFKSKHARDAWVHSDDYRDGHPHREAVSYKIVRRVLGSHVCAIPDEDNNRDMLIADPYRNICNQSIWDGR